MKTLLVLIFLFLSCKPNDGVVKDQQTNATTTGTSSSLPADKFQAFQTIIRGQCIPCHQEGGPQKSFEFETEEEWVKSYYVVPGQPENSFIYYSLKGAGVRPAEEFAPTIGKLPQNEIDAIREWILSLDQ
ncbi:MAG: hypothetical protein H6621_02910 [Halobacteriovoraceae bacterium]|nr:hypothetical protein [Halobacteriovoraceae bacterium]MCB9093995.1 hypothetical protein [Halobacteriovoraceae bacterium]